MFIFVSNEKQLDHDKNEQNLKRKISTFLRSNIPETINVLKFLISLISNVSKNKLVWHLSIIFYFWQNSLKNSFFMKTYG